MGWIFVRRKRRKRAKPKNTKHYLEHKEAARVLVQAKLAFWNVHYPFPFKRVAIRNSRSRWGSCSANKNLNFNYKILFLPPSLQDYIIVHELCHLKELNHKKVFWDLVGEQIPDYEERIKLLRHHEKEISAAGSSGTVF